CHSQHTHCGMDFSSSGIPSGITGRVGGRVLTLVKICSFVVTSLDLPSALAFSLQCLGAQCLRARQLLLCVHRVHDDNIPARSKYSRPNTPRLHVSAWSPCLHHFTERLRA